MKKFMSHFKIKFVLFLLVFVALPFTKSIDNMPANSNLASAISENSSITLLESTTKTLNDTDSSTTNPPTANFQPNSDLIIKAINPGYSKDDKSDVGELIELTKTTNTSLSLAGYSVYYINKSGNATLLFEFADGSVLTGESLLMRYARSPDSDRADLKYSTTLAMTAGTVEVRLNNQVVNSVCWGNKSNPDCLSAFQSGSYKTAVRDLSTGFFAELDNYEPTFDPDAPNLYLPPLSDDSPTTNNPSTTEKPPVVASKQCAKLEFSEILTYYVNDKSEQFIELYNPTDQTVKLDGCNLRYKKKLYPLTGEILAENYYQYIPTTFTFTKNPTSSNEVELIDTDESIVDILTYTHGQKKSTSFARFYTANGEEIWDLTYAPTPAAENIYQKFRTCPEGKVINPDTGNCVKAATSTDKTLEPCPEGKYRNPLTGRCKNVASTSSTQKPCAEGYERNPETNRCRKVKTANEGTDYALVPQTKSSKSTFVALGIVILLVLLGVVYIVLQFRREIARATRKARQRIHHILKHLVARRIGFHRKQKP